MSTTAVSSKDAPAAAGTAQLGMKLEVIRRPGLGCQSRQGVLLSF